MTSARYLLPERDEHPTARPSSSLGRLRDFLYTSFGVNDVRAEHKRLGRLDVRFTQATAVFDDTCGNLIQIASGNP